MRKFDYITLQFKKHDGFNAYGWSTYPENSVLAGQAMKCFIDTFETREEAEAAFPDAQWSSEFTEPQPSYNHLPEEDY